MRQTTDTKAHEVLQYHGQDKQKLSSPAGTAGMPRRIFLEKMDSVLGQYSSKNLFSCRERILTGNQIKAELDTLTEHFRRLVPCETVVGVCLPNSADLALLILSVIKAGKIPLLISSEVSSSEARDMEELSLFNTVVTSTHFTSKFKGFNQLIYKSAQDSDCGAEITSELLPYQSEMLKGSPPLRHRTSATDTALILQTSGSSGKAKFRSISFEALNYVIEAVSQKTALSENTVTAVTLPMSHTMALNTQFFPTFFAGGRCHFTDSKYSLGRLYRNLFEADATFTALVSNLLEVCEEEMEQRHLSSNQNIKTVVLAGGSIGTHHLKLAKKLFPKAEIYKGYGLTEAIRVSMIGSSEEGFWEEHVGRPLIGQLVKIVDEKGAEVGEGCLGELLVKGPNTQNYDTLSGAPLTNQDGYLPTGDLGQILPGGFIKVLGRRDRMFKNQGRKIYPLQIENVLSQTEIAKHWICLPKPCRRSGQRPVVFATFRNEEHLGHLIDSLEVLADLFREALPAFKRPREIYFLPSFPKLKNGKIDYGELARLLSEEDGFSPFPQKKIFKCFYRKIETFYSESAVAEV